MKLTASRSSSGSPTKTTDYSLRFKPLLKKALAETKATGTASKKKTTSSGKKAVAKVKESKETKVSKKVSKSPVKKDKPAPITKGPNATHAIDADTGKAVKLSASARKANAAYEAKSNMGRPALQPAVNLEEPTFTPKTPGPRNKGGKK